ncbi:enhancer of yellow 2b transcription factor [Drosophila sulfurigaster albostrigata]|uniref:enhancer of yellow 2b transcription factor n=1 Tax=Drosophila sulfurigaster albostrigata TaxID=89887 RepID=UPI002D21C36B|nr:enhancer of yellow 2b transcription factor [Drosophila sulfurigaster albostrigata]
MSKSKETGIGTDPACNKNYHLDKSEKVALKDLLQKRLHECGWYKDVEEKIRNTLQERGLSNITHDQLSAEIIPQARALVPEEVRKEMTMRVREALESPLPTIGNGKT